jgi:hypothetical protein
VQLIAQKLEKVTPATFGFTNANSLAAFQSNPNFTPFPAYLAD